MAEKKKLNEDLRKSYTHERPKPPTKPPQNRQPAKPQNNGGNQNSSNGKDK